MKKYFVIIGAAILVMALAAPSMAQFKSWGHMEIQTIWEMKPDFNTGRGGFNQGVAASTPAEQKRDLNWKHIAERFRFYLQYGDPKTVRAVIGFEADSQEWGELRGSGTTTGGRMGAYTVDSVQLEVKHAYLDFVIPNTPVSIVAGLQNFDFGGRLFMNCDAPGVQVIGNFAPHKITAFWWRENDGIQLTSGTQSSPVARSTYGVNDTYGLEYKLAQKNYNIAAFAAYKNDLWTLQGGNGSVDINYDEHPWWIGASAGFRPGNFDIFGQFIYNGGKFKYNGPTLAGFDDIKLRAWAAELSAKYRIGPGMFVGLEGFYATGNDSDDADKYKLYQVPTNSESQSIFGNDRTVIFWMNAAQMGYYHQANLAFMGMWYGRANFEYSPTAWVRFNLNYLYIGDNTKGTPGVYTDGPLAGRQKIVNSPGTYSNSSDPRTFNSAATQNVDKKTVGQEINLITSLNIYQGFVYHIGLAVFLPGDVYDVYDTAGNKTRSADTAYAINSKLVYAF